MAAPVLTATPSLSGSSAAGPSRRIVQRKLAVGRIDDPAETEADRFAEEVLAERPRFRNNRPARLRARAEEPESWSAPPDVERAIATPGLPMTPDFRAEMEARSGHTFSDVRIHADTEAAASARTMGALAYAVGPHLIFGDGQFSPTTWSGRRLIAHELAHVVQQRAAGPASLRVARQADPQVPPVLSFLTPQELQKLRGFGDADFQESLRTLEGHLRKTKGFTTAGDTQKYVDIRQAAGELRTFRDYVNDPAVVAVKVVPSATGGRSPDMYVRTTNNQTRRVEISNVTAASPDYRPDARVDANGRVSPRIPRDDAPDAPGRTVVSLPTNEFDPAAIKGAIRSKIKSTPARPSQLEAQNANTRAGGAPMATGGDVVVQVTHGEIGRARLDQLIEELEPELLASAANRVVVNAVDADEPRAGRKIFEYTREGRKFVGAVRQPNAPAALAAEAGPAVPGLGQGLRPGVLRGLGGAIFTLLVQLAIAYLLQKVAEHFDRKQVEAALEKLKPELEAKLTGLSREIMERQSAGKDVYAKLTYSLNYLHGLEDTTQRSLYFGESPADVDSNNLVHQNRLADQTMTVFSDAKLVDLVLGDGNAPADESSFSIARDASGTFETQTYTFVKATRLGRYSDTELRDYVLQEALAAELGPDAGAAGGREDELRHRLDTLQGNIEKQDATRRADAERERLADEQRKRALLEASRHPAPPRSDSPPLLPTPGVSSSPTTTASARSDPFNLGGRPEQKSPMEQAAHAADIAEALKDEFVQKGTALKQGNASSAQIEAHHAALEQWIAALGQVHAAWKERGSTEWPGVKRLAYLVWWVNEPEGRAALFR